MRNTDYFRNKRIAIVGLARSGLACANLLHALGCRVRITDQHDTPEIRQNAARLASSEIRIELGGHSRKFLEGQDMLVISPGVAQSALPVVWAQEHKIPVLSEIEVGWILCPCPVVAVTGSSGKTTVTTLIGLVLAEDKRKSFVCGNIGNPFTGEVAKMKDSDYAIVEISSFQLEHIHGFKPKIAVVTNISRNHLDRYPGMQEYISAKKRIFLNSDATDYLVLNSQDEELRGWEHEAAARVVFFSKETGLNPNQAAVLSVGSILAIDKKTCVKVFKNFKGLPHRMEEVDTVNGVTFINDSKATTAEACLWALQSLEAPVILIAGGKDKGVDYGIIRDACRDKVKCAILIGEAKQKLRDSLDGAVALSESETLRDAVRQGFSKASPGDIVILSPMCSSFDMFSDYQQRGEVFKQAVAELALGEPKKPW